MFKQKQLTRKEDLDKEPLPELCLRRHLTCILYEVYWTFSLRGRLCGKAVGLKVACLFFFCNNTK